jgi:hypothetical protein
MYVYRNTKIGIEHIYKYMYIPNIYIHTHDIYVCIYIYIFLIYIYTHTTYMYVYIYIFLIYIHTHTTRYLGDAIFIIIFVLKDTPPVALHVHLL